MLHAWVLLIFFQSEMVLLKLLGKQSNFQKGTAWKRKRLETVNK